MRNDETLFPLYDDSFLAVIIILPSRWHATNVYSSAIRHIKMFKIVIYPHSLTTIHKSYIHATQFKKTKKN